MWYFLRTSFIAILTPQALQAHSLTFISTLGFVLGLITWLPDNNPVSALGDPIIVAAGDIACDPARPQFREGNGTSTACHQKATAAIVMKTNPTAVLALGDTQYISATPSEYSQSYDPSWGAFKNITRPAIGNHEYHTADASGYFEYFGAAAGDPEKAYYSYDIGAWHLIALNSECINVGGCGPGSAQEEWLKGDLAAHPNKCTLAYWHDPRFSSSNTGNQEAMAALWEDLYAAGADIVLSAHGHVYERFARQTPQQVADPVKGIRQFVVGTGGNSHGSFSTIQPNSQVRDNTTFGVLKLTLHPESYDWQFLPEAGKSFTDSGTTACH